MTWDIFWELAVRVGLPFALVVVALLAVLRGDVVTKKSHDAMIDIMNTRLSEKDERIAELWEIVKPLTGVARGAVTKLEEERGAGRGARR